MHGSSPGALGHFQFIALSSGRLSAITHENANVLVMNTTYWRILALFFLSGVSALAYETLWQRQMLPVFGANLYSREYFQLTHHRLSEGGIACAWIPLKLISQDQLRILMRTFRSVFPSSTLCNAPSTLPIWMQPLLPSVRCRAE